MTEEPDIFLSRGDMENLKNGDIIEIGNAGSAGSFVTIGAECPHDDVDIVQKDFIRGDIVVTLHCNNCGKSTSVDITPREILDNFVERLYG